MSSRTGPPPFQARQLLRDFRVFDIVQITPEIIEQGADSSILNTISFLDGLIIASASAAKRIEVISEVLNDARCIQGIVVRSPFR